MASFVIHMASAEELLKNLNLSKEDTAKFYAGNLLPDTSFQKNNDNLPEVEKRNLIQKEKIVSHFRTDLTNPFQYPNLEYFLSIYGEKVKHDPLLLGIFYHLYIDCKFYRDFLPSFVKTLDADKNICFIRDSVQYMTIKRSNHTVPVNEFFSYHGGLSIYEEYNRLNDYILSKYDIGNNIDDYLEIIRDTKLTTEIPEVNIDEAYNVLLLFKMIISKNKIPRPLNIFTEESIIDFIKNTSNEFINIYNDIYNSYK